MATATETDKEWFRLAPPAVQAVWREYERATQKFGTFNSTHEGYAVIKEELDELWDDIKANADVGPMAGEATQVAAMGIRFLMDCCDAGEWRGEGS